MAKRSTFSFKAPVGYIEREDMSPEISGFAIHPGLFNGVVEIPEDELGNLKNSLEGSQLRYDHGNSVLSVIGKVHETIQSFDEDARKQGVKYFADTIPDDQTAADVLKRVKGGYVNDSSIQFKHDSICSKCGEDFNDCEHWFSDGAHVIAKNCDGFEISVVTKGADGDASAYSALSEKEFKTKFIEQFKAPDKKEPTNGGNSMVNDPKNDPVDLSKLISELTDARNDAAKKGADIATLQSQIDELNKAKKELDALKKDTSKDDELAKAQDELKKAQEALAKVDEAKFLEEVGKLAELKVQKGLVKKAELDKEIEALKEFAPETISALMLQVEGMKDKEVADPNEGKIPKISGFTKDELESMSEKEFDQRMAHTIFHYDTVFKEAGNIEGVSYRGFKQSSNRG